MTTDHPTTSNTDVNLLSVTDVVKTFGGLTALDHVSFDIREGAITGLIGPNGAGKTTMFNAITGHHKIDSGSITYDGADIENKRPFEVARSGIGRTFQIPRIFEGMTVAENLAYGVPDQPGETVFNVVFRGNEVADYQAKIDERVAETLDFLSIEHLRNEYASGLSGGQRALLGLGQVLMLDPELFLLDEPMSGVNPALADRLLDRLHALNDQGKTLLIVEHDIELIMQNCDDVIVMSNGEVLAKGRPETVQQDDRVIEAYIGT